jgi:hypothetical protein
MRCFVAVNMFYFDIQLRSDLDCSSDKVKTHNDFMNYDLDPRPFTRSRAVLKEDLNILYIAVILEIFLQAKAKTKGH